MAMPVTHDESADRRSCWCCGREQKTEELVRLGHHPEVEVCLRCAHFLHQQARRREDALTRAPAARGRDGLRALRDLALRHNLQRKPLIGPILRWLGPRVP